MPSSYPTQNDHFTPPSLPSSTPLSSPGDSARNHVESHRDLGDAIVALQNHVAKKAYVDNELNKKVNKTGTTVAVADGGTGASSASAARTNLGIPTFYTSATEPSNPPEGSIWFQVV